MDNSGYNNNQLVIWMLLITLILFLVILIGTAFADEIDRPFARFTWQPAPDFPHVEGYKVLVIDTTGEVIYSVLTDTCSITVPLTWQEPVSLRILPVIVADSLSWSDNSDTISFSLSGIWFDEDGQLVTSPDSPTIQESTDLIHWQPSDGHIRMQVTQQYFRVVQ